MVKHLDPDDYDDYNPAWLHEYRREHGDELDVTDVPSELRVPDNWEQADEESSEE